MPDPTTAIIGSSAASAGSNIVGSIFGSKAQKRGAERAIAAEMEMFAQLQALQRELYGKAETNLNPYIDMGRGSANNLVSRMPELTSPIELTQEWLEKTPGYQFVKNQGLRAVNLKGPLSGLSGAQLKGAADFVTGLADQTYKTQFDVANVNKTNAFNRLFQTAQLGEDASKALSTVGQSGINALTTAGTSIGKDIGAARIGQGNAEGAAIINTGQNASQFISGLPFAPYTASRLYPGNEWPKAAGGMYGDQDPTVPLPRPAPA